MFVDPLCVQADERELGRVEARIEARIVELSSAKNQPGSEQSEQELPERVEKAQLQTAAQLAEQERSTDGSDGPETKNEDSERQVAHHTIEDSMESSKSVLEVRRDTRVIRNRICWPD